MFLFALLLCMFGVWWWHQPTKPNAGPTRVSHSMPSSCDSILMYRLADVDPAFGLTQGQLEPLVHDAANAWNQALGKTVLLEDKQQGFAIRFVYDARQQQMLKLAINKNNLSRYDARIAELQQDFAEKLQQFTDAKTVFAKQDRQLATDISKFNEKAQQADIGAAASLGREQAELLSLQKEHAFAAEALDAEQDKLRQQQAFLNDLIAERNNLLKDVSSSDPTSSPALTEVGLMEQQGDQRQMTIFAYQNQQTLLITLMHEFGHALGINHIAAENAIMHAQLNPDQHQLSGQDLLAYQQLCPAKE